MHLPGEYVRHQALNKRGASICIVSQCIKLLAPATNERNCCSLCPLNIEHALALRNRFIVMFLDADQHRQIASASTVFTLFIGQGCWITMPLQIANSN